MFRATISYLYPTPNGVLLRVKAHSVFGGRSTDVELTRDEYERLLRWQSENLSIQNVFPEWSASKRELFMTGMNNGDWERNTR